MESVQISLHQLHVCAFAFAAKGWFTSRELATKTHVCSRTVRRHLHRLTALGVLECRSAFGGSRYRRKDVLDERAIAYVQRLWVARETFERRGAILDGLKPPAEIWRAFVIFMMLEICGLSPIR